MTRGILSKFKPLVLDDPGPGNLVAGVVHNRVSLVIVRFKHLCFETHRTVLQLAKRIIKVFIDRAGKDQPVVAARMLLHVFLPGDAKQRRHSRQEFFHNLRVSSDRNPLITVVEIIIVIGKTHGEPPDNKCRQVSAFPAPLLFGIILHQLLIYITSHQGERLLLQVLRLFDVQLGDLLFNLRPGFIRRHHSPHLREGVHVERQIVQFIPVARHR